MSYDLDALDVCIFDEARSVMKARFPEVVEGYLEDAEVYIGKIKDGFARNDKAAVAQYAHPLKSSSAGLGVMSVSEIAKDLEYGAKIAIDEGSDITHLKALLVPIDDAFKRAELHLKKVL